MRLARIFVPALAVLSLGACDLDKDPGGPDAEELAGQWVGPITRTDPGSEAESVVMFDLKSDGTFVVSVEDTVDFRDFADGLWGTTGMIVTGAGQSTDGRPVQFSAPRSETRLEGAWSAGQDYNGLFDVTRQ